jgi:hypothetical protein
LRQTAGGNRVADTAGGRVFISHSADDAAVAAQICAAIEQRGIACWIAPRNIRAGDDFLESIQRAIESATAFVIVLSGASAESPFVLSETEVAFSYKRPIFPVRIEPVEPGRSLKLLLSRWHRVDAIGSGRDAGLRRLADAVARRVSAGAGSREVYQPRPAQKEAVEPRTPDWRALLAGPLWFVQQRYPGATAAACCALLALGVAGAALDGPGGAGAGLFAGWFAVGGAALLAKPTREAAPGSALAGAGVAAALLILVVAGFGGSPRGIAQPATVNLAPGENLADDSAPAAARVDQDAIAADQAQQVNDMANAAATATAANMIMAEQNRVASLNAAGANLANVSGM